MGKHLEAECAAARKAVVEATGRHWWEVYAVAYPETGRLVHVRFLQAGEEVSSLSAYIYDPDSENLVACNPRLHALDALIEATYR